MKTLIVAAVGLALGMAVGLGVTLVESFRIEDDFSAAHQVESDTSVADASARPRVTVVNGESFDFGVMENNTTLSHVFVLRNDGTAPLKLIKGDTTCKCTISELTKSSIPPGQTAEVTLSWTPKSYSDTFEQSASIGTSDPSRNMLRLVIKGHVIPKVRAIPDEVVLPGVLTSETKTVDVQLLTFQPGEIQLTKFEFANPDTADFFDVDVAPLPAAAVAKTEYAQSGLRIRLTVKPGLPLGPFRQTIRLDTPSSEKPIEVPIHGTVVGDLSIFGKDFKRESNVLKLGVVSRAAGARAELYLTVTGPYHNDVLVTANPDHTVPNDVLQVSVSPPDDSSEKYRKYQLTIEIPPHSRNVVYNGPKPEDWGKIVLTTTHPTFKNFEFYVRFSVAD